MENYFQLCLSGSTDVCNVFHLLFIISFQIQSGFTLKKCYLADVSVCFWLLWAGFKRLFLFCASLLKENPLGFYNPPVPHGLSPDAPEWKTVVCSDTGQIKVLINCYCLEGRAFDNMNLS